MVIQDSPSYLHSIVELNKIRGDKKLKRFVI